MKQSWFVVNGLSMQNHQHGAWFISFLILNPDLSTTSQQTKRLYAWSIDSKRAVNSALVGCYNIFTKSVLKCKRHCGVRKQLECVVMSWAVWGFGKRCCFVRLICSAPLCSELISSARQLKKACLMLHLHPWNSVKTVTKCDKE